MVIGILVGSALVVALPASAGEVDVGEREYRFKCAVCHGDAGKGDGPYRELLKIVPTDLTMLQKNHGGSFPFEKVFRVIDGRANIKAHGSRTMPIWGNEYTDEAIEYYGDLYGTHNAELFVQGRILALITYLQGIQQP